MADLSGEANKAMQVDESNDLHTAGKDAKFDRPTTTDNSQRSPKFDTRIARGSEPPQDNAVILVSPEEDPSGKGASQCSSDSMFCERVYQELQQQLEDAQAKETRWSPRTRMQTRSKSYICPNDTLVGHSCGTLFWDTLVGYSCGSLL